PPCCRERRSRWRPCPPPTPPRPRPRSACWARPQRRSATCASAARSPAATPGACAPTPPATSRACSSQSPSGPARPCRCAAASPGGRSPGPLIFEEDGEPVWFDRLPPSGAASNLQVQQLGGRPVLTWWQGYIPEQGFGEGEEVIVDSSYNQVGRVHAGNGYKADLHEFRLMPQGTALLSVFAPVACDLSSLGGPK